MTPLDRLLATLKAAHEKTTPGHTALIRAYARKMDNHRSDIGDDFRNVAQLLESLPAIIAALKRLARHEQDYAHLTAEIARKDAALKPFADLYDPRLQMFLGNAIEIGNFGYITLVDLLRARAALAPAPETA